MRLQSDVHGHDDVIRNFIGVVCYMSITNVNISSQVQIHVLRDMTVSIFVSAMMNHTPASVEWDMS